MLFFIVGTPFSLYTVYITVSVSSCRCSYSAVHVECSEDVDVFIEAMTVHAVHSSSQLSSRASQSPPALMCSLCVVWTGYSQHCLFVCLYCLFVSPRRRSTITTEVRITFGWKTL